MGAELEIVVDNPAVQEIIRQWKKVGGIYRIAAEEVEKELVGRKLKVPKWWTCYPELGVKDDTDG